MFQKLILSIIIVICYSISYANPAPLGIKLNETTVDKVKEKYGIQLSEKNIIKGYYNNTLDLNNIDIKTISDVQVITNEQKIVEGVILSLAKHKFNEIYTTLKSKYELLTANIPFVGDNYVKLQDNDCYVIINSPHMSFTMKVTYVTKSLYNKNIIRVKEDEKLEEKQRQATF